MKAKILVCALLVVILATIHVAEAQQQPERVYRIGYLRAETPPAVDTEGFRQGLREHGYEEGKNVVIEYRWADGNEERLRSQVAELIRLKFDLIVTSAPAATRAAKEVTSTVPIVMVPTPLPSDSLTAWLIQVGILQGSPSSCLS